MVAGSALEMHDESANICRAMVFDGLDCLLYFGWVRADTWDDRSHQHASVNTRVRELPYSSQTLEGDARYQVPASATHPRLPLAH